LTFPAADWVEHHARVKPCAIALRSVDSFETRSWGALEERVGRLANGLRHEIGLSAGDRVVTLMEGDIRSFELQFACLRAGLIFAPLNFRLSVAELSELCLQLVPGLMVTDSTWQQIAQQVVTKASIPRCMVSAIGGNSELDSLIDGSSHMSAQHHSPDATTHILFTSGTTGMPKGAMSTHTTLLWQALNQVQLCRVAEEGAHVLTPLPLFHAGGLNSLSNPILFFGGEVSIASRFNPEAVLGFVGNPANRTTHLALAPVMYQFMAETPEFQAADFSTVRLALVAGGRVPGELRQKYAAKNVFFHVQYGGTETGPTITALDHNEIDKLIAGSCGKAVMHVEIRLVDDAGHDVSVGKEGEVWIKGPAVTTGYWRHDPAAAFTDGWFRTGDIARRDAEGFYFIVDRIKDMYKSGGENVSSSEVEAVLLRHPSIAECAVIGVPDPKWGEVGLAVIRPKPGENISLEIVHAACASHLARYKYPRYIELVDNFPRNVTGKISKTDLRNQFGGTRTA
jgi:fatty-acyl-CoA synthase